MATLNAKIGTPVGLHSRPASKLVQAVKASGHVVTLQRRDAHGDLSSPINAGSIIAVLGFAAQFHENVVINVPGDESEMIAENIKALLESDLDG